MHPPARDPDVSRVQVAESTQLFQKLLVKRDVVPVDGKRFSYELEVTLDLGTKRAGTVSGVGLKVVLLEWIASQIVELLLDGTCLIELAQRAGSKEGDVFGSFVNESDL